MEGTIETDQDQETMTSSREVVVVVAEEETTEVEIDQKDVSIVDRMGTSLNNVLLVR